MATSTPKESCIPEDWQTTKQTVRERTTLLFNNSLMSDIKFVVSHSQSDCCREVVSVPAHKLILGISSPVFEAMFYGGMAEKQEEIKLPDTDSEQLLEFFRFLYCDEVYLSPRNVLGILYLANKYMVPSLALRCRNFCEKGINERNVFEMLIQAQELDETRVEQTCWKVIENNTASCLQSEGLHYLDRDTVVALLQRDSLIVNEVVLFNAIRRWAEGKCQQQGLEPPSGAQVRKVLGDAVYHFRFPLMLVGDFGKHVLSTGVLTEADILNMSMYYNASSAPEELNFSDKPRSISDQWKKSVFRCSTCDSEEKFSSVKFTCPISEYLHFTVNKVAYFGGVRLFADYEEAKEYEVRLVLKGRDENRNTVPIQQVEGNFTTAKGGEQNIVGFDVTLDKPVLLKKSERYTICISIAKRETEFICKRVKFTNSYHISCSGVEITLEGLSTQILELLLITKPYSSHPVAVGTTG